VNRVGDLPAQAGVYALIGSRPQADQHTVGYVGVCANLRHRAAIWDYNFKQRATNPAHEMPVKNLPPEIPSESWTFLGWTDADSDEVRKALADKGVILLNDKTRVHELITYKGKTCTFAEHCRDHDIKYSRAYARLKKGKTLDEVFAAKPPSGMQKSTAPQEDGGLRSDDD
jgi:hypothetical protein